MRGKPPHEPNKKKTANKRYKEYWRKIKYAAVRFFQL